MVIIEENNYIEKFFHKHSKYSDEIKRQIYEGILIIINERPHKIKTAHGYKYEGQTIYEYKIVLSEQFACRVAYIHQQADVLVFYLTTTLLKRSFVAEVSRLVGVTKG